MLETGQRRIRPEHIRAYLAVLGPGSLMFTEASDGAEVAAEWARRVALSDVSSETIAAWSAQSTIWPPLIRRPRRIGFSGGSATISAALGN